MSVALTEFVPRVQREAPNCPEFTVVQAIRDACRAFAKDTYIWRETLDPVSARANQTVYDIEPLNRRMRVISILSMRHNTNVIYPKTEDDLDALNPYWRDQKGKQAIWFVQETSVTFRPVPYIEETQTRAFKNIRVAVIPTTDATEVGDILYDEHEEDIAHGALARVLAIREKPWTDPNMALYHAEMFATAIGTAKVRAKRGFTRASEFLPPMTLPGAP